MRNGRLGGKYAPSFSRVFPRKEAEECPQFFPFEEQVRRPLDKLRGTFAPAARVCSGISAIVQTSRSILSDRASGSQVCEVPPQPLSAPADTLGLSLRGPLLPGSNRGGSDSALLCSGWDSRMQRDAVRLVSLLRGVGCSWVWLEVVVSG